MPAERLDELAGLDTVLFVELSRPTSGGHDFSMAVMGVDYIRPGAPGTRFSGAPIILGIMGRLMLRPSKLIVREYHVPDEVLNTQAQRERVQASLAKIRELCEELGLAFLPWSPLGGLSSAKGLAGKHPAFKAVAERHGVSAQRVALAWELAQSACVIPIPGAKRPESITDSAAAADLELSPDDLAALDAG